MKQAISTAERSAEDQWVTAPNRALQQSNAIARSLEDGLVPRGRGVCCPRRPAAVIRLVVHVDACARRLGLYCEWGSWERGVTAKPRSRAVELTFARAEPVDPS
jgi:hypothetical protein